MLAEKSGFTLIELLAVITILSILSVVTVIKIPDYNPAKLNIARDCLITDIKLTQNMAISQKKIFGLKFDVAQGNYQVYQGDGNYSNIINNLADGAPFTVEFKSKFPGNHILSSSLAGETVQFDAKGIPYDSAGILTTTKNIILKQELTNAEQVIYIVPHTGFATVLNR